MIRAVGLISGTSMDGIDAAAVEITERPDLQVELRASLSRPYPPIIGETLAVLCRPGAGLALNACRTTMVLGELFAEAALAVIEQAGWTPDQVHLIGSHGQTTVSDFNERSNLAGYRAFSTLQLGHPAVIAERTGITVVADFRARDIAARGRGAPLAPMLDYLLYRSPGHPRVLLNLGGIANVTFLPASGDQAEVIGFDTGPANMPLDLLVRRWSDGQETYDRDGAIAAGGQVLGRLLDQLLLHPFTHQPPPKATGSEDFGDAFIEQVLGWAPGASLADLLATLTEFTARTVHDAIRRWYPGREAPVDVVGSGGGIHNLALMERLRGALAPTPLRTLDEVGGDVDAKEAVLFAVLGYLTLLGRAGSIPSVTGAGRAAPLGSITPGRLGLAWPSMG
ncbi:MAG TPA: anhydro-N-acetylmuramic acid kinase [Chloroflexota bacterium]|nr:anhydro-N-acetylmuramic acid kinase [Chloroflexota bacterium]